ncbi:MAG: hypothetical protein GY940_12310, partial [bacterium]|nr:hypothetical protein [bacterium]
MGEETADKGALAYKKLRDGDRLTGSGAIVEAVKAYLEGAALYEEALKEQPGKSSYKNNYKYCLGKTGYIQLIHAKKLAEQQKYAGSARFYDSAIKAYEYALTKFPGNRNFPGNIEYARVNGAKAHFAHLVASKAKAPAFKLESFSGGTLDSEGLKGKV